MSILSDSSIKALLLKTPNLVEKFPLKGGWMSEPLSSTAWDTYASPIQPCSIDLHIGNIFTPGARPGDLGSTENGHTSLILEPGQSVIVMSHEKLNLPGNIAAIALPPSRISSAGILIANFGHIDPGYSGHLRFTIINMGKEPYGLSQGEMIITVLLFEVANVAVPFNVRAPEPKPDRPSRSEIDILASDFANITETAKRIAAAEVERSGFMRLWWPALLSMLAGAVFGIAGYWVSIKLDFANDIRALHELRSSYGKLEAKLDTLSTDLQKVEGNNKFLIERLIQKNEQ